MGSPSNSQDPAVVQDTASTNSHDPPPPPQPEKDAGIIPPVKSPIAEGLENLSPDNIDIFELDSVAALKLLCRNVEVLVATTGDVPPTPPVRSPGHSPSRSLSHGPSGLNATVSSQPQTPRKENLAVPGMEHQVQDRIDGVPFQKTPMGSPIAQPGEPVSVVVGANAQPLHIQHGALARKFYSKRPPPISLEDYLMRMHKYCPMSTAVYLATSYYITQLAVVDHVVPVTPRNVHRLLLAGLRVAMKALEDLSWPHSRFSKVGGVSETELGKLEVTFCFLMDFTLKVDPQMLQNEAETLCRNSQSTNLPESGSAILDAVSGSGAIQLRLPTERNRAGTTGSTGSTAEKRKASSSLPMRPVQLNAGIGIVGQS